MTFAGRGFESHRLQVIDVNLLARSDYRTSVMMTKRLTKSVDLVVLSVGWLYLLIWKLNRNTKDHKAIRLALTVVIPLRRIAQK